MRSNRRTFCAVAILSAVLSGPAWAQSVRAPIQITADLSDAPRMLFHAEVDLPVGTGPLALTTPTGLRGHHRAGGPVDNFTGVIFPATDQPGAWRGGDVDLSQFRVTIP